MSESEFDKIKKRVEKGTHSREDILDLIDAVDFYHDTLPEVYCHITGNVLSYPDYPAASVICAYEDNLERERGFWEECFREENDCRCGL